MIPDDLKRTFSDLADKVKEGGKQLGAQAQLQVQLRKLQVEHARRIHELGKQTYDWYQSGTMIVSGPVPAEVAATCKELDEIKGKVAATERQMEEAGTQAASTPPVNGPPSTPPAIMAPPDPHATQSLND